MKIRKWGWIGFADTCVFLAALTAVFAISFKEASARGVFHYTWALSPIDWWRVAGHIWLVGLSGVMFVLALAIWSEVRSFFSSGPQFLPDSEDNRPEEPEGL